MHVHVAVPVPGLGALTYSVPDGLRDPVVGARVLVPLGTRTVTGIVLGPDGDRGLTPKPLADVLDGEPFLPKQIVDLCQWVADYYACGIGEAIATAMPPRAWIESERRVRITDLGHARLLTLKGPRRTVLDALEGGKVLSVEALLKKAGVAHGTLTALERERLVELTQPLRGSADASRMVGYAVLTAQGCDTDARLGPRQQAAMALLRGVPDGMAVAALEQAGVGRDALARLVRAGLVRVERRPFDRDPFERSPSVEERTPIDALTAEQAAALEALRARASGEQFETVLLHGVTGPGRERPWRDAGTVRSCRCR